jgi:hypothetical protein
MLTALIIWFAVSIPVALLVGSVIRFGSGE